MKKIMKGLVYGGPGKIELKEIPRPELLKPTDVVVKVLKTTICGTDLGILHGKTPSCLPGTTLGHEGVGIVDEAGSSVRNFKKGDHVIISHNTSAELPADNQRVAGIGISFIPVILPFADGSFFGLL